MIRQWLFRTMTLSALLAGGGLASTAYAAASACPYPLTDMNRPIAPPNATPTHATFTDPTAETSSPEFVMVSEQVYIAPFARLEAQSVTDNICIEHASNVQDNTLVKANGGPANLGVHSIMAHGSQRGGRRVRTGGFGEETTRIGAFSFVGKEAVVFRADIEPGTLVGAKAVLAGYTNCTNPRGPTNDPNADCHPNNQSPFPAPEVIPDRCVKFDVTPRNSCAYFVEW